jgi:outer membrane receptor protein involved in Fe transport
MVDEDDQEYTVPATGPFPTYDVDRRGERRRRDWNAHVGAEVRYRALGLRQATLATLEHAVAKHEEEFSSVVISGGTSAFWMHLRTAIAGLGVRQSVQLREDATLVGGIRLDQVRANDQRWDVPVSGHVSLAWDLPAVGALTRSRLRASLGDVANVPMTARLVFVTPGPERPKAEFTREREVGFDATVLENRVATSLTWYTKRTTSVGNLVRAPQPFPSSAAFQYIEILNRGIEASVQAHILRRSRLSWEARAWYAYNHNEVTGSSPTPLALDRFGFGEIGFSGRQWVRPGAPLGAVQSRPIVELRDLDDDGLVDNACAEITGQCEAVLASSFVYQPVHPPTSASLATSLRFGRLTLSALLDHRPRNAQCNT